MGVPQNFGCIRHFEQNFAYLREMLLRAITIDSLDCVSPSSRRRVGGRSYKVVSIKVFFKVKPAAGADFLGFDSGNYGKTMFLNTSTVLFTD